MFGYLKYFSCFILLTSLAWGAPDDHDPSLPDLPEFTSGETTRQRIVDYRTRLGHLDQQAPWFDQCREILNLYEQFLRRSLKAQGEVRIILDEERLAQVEQLRETLLSHIELTREALEAEPMRDQEELIDEEIAELEDILASIARQISQLLSSRYIRVQSEITQLTSAASTFSREIHLQDVSENWEWRTDGIGSFLTGIGDGIVAGARKLTRSSEYQEAESSFLAAQNELLAMLDEVLADSLTSDEEKRQIYLSLYERVGGPAFIGNDEAGRNLSRTLDEAYEKTLRAWREVNPVFRDYDLQLVRSLERVVQRVRQLVDTYGFIMSETEYLKRAQRTALSNAIAFNEGHGQMLGGAIERFNRLLLQVRQDQQTLMGELERRAGETRNYDIVRDVLQQIVAPSLEEFEGIEEIPNGFFSSWLASVTFNHRALQLQIEATLQGSPLFRLWAGEDSPEEEVFSLLIEAREQAESANFAMTLASIAMNQANTPIAGVHLLEGTSLDPNPRALGIMPGLEEGIGWTENFILTISSLAGNGEFLEAGKQFLWAPVSIFLPFWGITDEAAKAHLSQVALFGVAYVAEAAGVDVGYNTQEVIRITDAEIEQLRQNGNYNIPEDEFNPYRLVAAIISGALTCRVILKPVALMRRGVVEPFIYRIVRRRIGDQRFAAEITRVPLDQLRSMSPNQILELAGLNLRMPRTGRLTLVSWRFVAEKIRAELIRLLEERTTLRDHLRSAIENLDRIVPMTPEMELEQARLGTVLEGFQNEICSHAAVNLRWFHIVRRWISRSLSRSRQLSHQQIVAYVMERGGHLESWKQSFLERRGRGEAVSLEELMAFTLACEPKFGPLFGRAVSLVQFREVAARLLSRRRPEVFRDFFLRAMRVILPERNFISTPQALTEALYPLPETMREALGASPVRPLPWMRSPMRFARQRIIHEARTQLLRLWLMEGLKKAGIDFRALLREQAQTLRAKSSLTGAERQTLQNIEQFLELDRRYNEAFRDTNLDIFADDATMESSLDLTRLESRLRDFGSEWWGQNFRWVAWGAFFAIIFDIVDSMEQRSLEQQQYLIEHPDYREASPNQRIVIEHQRFSEEREQSQDFIEEVERVTPTFLHSLTQELERELNDEGDPSRRVAIEEDLRWCREELQRYDENQRR